MSDILKKVGFNKKFLLCSVLLVVFFIIILLVNYVLFPQIKLNGGEKIIVNYKDKFSDKGFVATHFGEDVTSQVVVKGEVNTSKLGSYKITYDVGKGIFHKKVTRNVIVVDNEKPKIDVSHDDIYVCPGDKYKTLKVKAIDNYDGDLSSKVSQNILKDKVVYSVSDSSGNKRVVSRNLFYKDNTPPKIELAGSSEVNICLSDEYQESGYTVTDNCDKDITGKIIGSIDKDTVGEYNLTYEAVDKAGNKSQAIRKVIVSENDTPGIVYLTFDDGPNPGTTDVILDILKEEGVLATFFVTGYGPDELIKREYDEGHTVALHTNVHDYQRVYASDEAYYADLNAVHDRVLNITGYDSKFIRFPGGSSNTVSRKYSSGIMSRITKGVLERGYKYYDWNISSGDAGGTTDPHQVYLNVTGSLRKDRVNNVLMHDSKAHTRDAIRDIIKYCKENNYEIRRISNCSTMVTQRVNN